MNRALLLAGWMTIAIGLPASAQADPEARLKELGITLPEVGRPMAKYVRAVRTGNLVFLAGHGPAQPWGKTATGKLGKDLTVAEGREAARNVGINLLASLKAEIGSLSKVRRIVKVLGMVNSTPDFMEQPEVINGFSELMGEVFGERGEHARSAVGMNSLPRNISVEIERVVEVDP